MGKVGQRWFVKRVRAGGETLMVSVALVILSSLVAACGGAEKAAKDFDDEGADKVANVKTGVKPEPDAEAAVIEMADPAYGRIVIELYPNIAPKMVERFKTLAKEGFYNGTAWHRVEPRSNVIQGGDPNSKDDNRADDGAGGSPYPDVPAEASDIPYEAGVVGAADSGPGTGNSQFFITLGRAPTWDRRYTAFGRVIEGMGNAQIISTAPTHTSFPTNPDPKIVIKSVTLQPRANFK